jgi:tetratricopeptide (TPR) repeat protein
MPNPKIEPLKKILALDPQDDVAWFGLGKAYMEDENWEAAAEAHERCITVKESYSAAYYALAQCLHRLGKYDRAIEICEIGIVVSTRNGDAMVTKNLESLKQLVHRP